MTKNMVQCTPEFIADRYIKAGPTISIKKGDRYLQDAPKKTGTGCT